jgi:hypothetical protein
MSLSKKYEMEEGVIEREVLLDSAVLPWPRLLAYRSGSPRTSAVPLTPSVSLPTRRLGMITNHVPASPNGHACFTDSAIDSKAPVSDEP